MPKQESVSPTSDFYKQVALHCQGKHVAIDMFLLGERHVDVATLSDAAKFTGGSIYHYPTFHLLREAREVKRFQKQFQRYLTRKVGLEAVLRIRCSKGKLH